MDESTDSICPQCGAGLDSEARFCSNCGHEVPVVVESDQATEVLDEASEPNRRSRRTWILAGTGVAIGVLVAGLALWGLLSDSEAERQYEASAPALMASLDDMSGAQSSKMVRDVAEQASGSLATIEAVLEEDPQASGADRLQTLSAAFGALSALDAYRVTNTEVWKDNKGPLESSLATLTSYGGPTEDAAVEGDDTVRTLDDLTRRIDKAMSKYRKQVKKARAQAKSERQGVRAYRSQMNSLMDQYTSLRNQTGNYTQRMRAERMYMFDIIDYFTQAATDRREIRDQMNRLVVPASMRSTHSRVTTALGDGAEAIDSAVAALEDAECYYGECYFEFDSQWEQFQSESDRITTRYGQAYDNWQAAMRKAENAASKQDLPSKPDL